MNGFFIKVHCLKFIKLEFETKNVSVIAWSYYQEKLMKIFENFYVAVSAPLRCSIESLLKGNFKSALITNLSIKHVEHGGFKCPKNRNFLFLIRHRLTMFAGRREAYKMTLVLS